MLDYGQQLANNLSSNVIELIGDVGAGKTTLVRGLALGLGVKTPISSPSFTISKSYALPNSEGRLIHYDFYRLSDPGLMSNDLADSLVNPQNIIIIEWGNSVANILPNNHTVITINKTQDDYREVRIIQPSIKSNTIMDSVASPSTSQPNISTQATSTDPTSLTLYLDTSTPETILRLNDIEYRYHFGHDLAEKLLAWIHNQLSNNNYTWQDISQIVFMSGPGSFTGLRIGAAIVNTLAHELQIPLLDHHGKQHPIIIPEYGRPANISAPRK